MVAVTFSISEASVRLDSLEVSRIPLLHQVSKEILKAGPIAGTECIAELQLEPASLEFVHARLRITTIIQPT
jgi:hypothetical protein